MDGKTEGILFIRGIRRDAGEEEINELKTTARYIRKEGKRYLFYRETAEDGSRNQVRLTIGEEEVLLQKKGSWNSSLHFRRGKDGLCRYQTPMGTMEMISHTRVIRREESDHVFRLKLEYSLFLSGRLLSEYELDA